jgi:hypothetical protein
MAGSQHRSERNRDVDPKRRPPTDATAVDLDAARRLVGGYHRGAAQPMPALDRGGRDRLLATLQHLYGNAAVQRIVAASGDTTVQRDRVYHDAHPVLVWKDFKGKVAPAAVFDAATQSGHTGLGYRGKIKKNGPDWDVELAIDPTSLNLRAFVERNKSWVRKAKKSADLLRHEQGHFNIEDVLVEKGETEIKAVSAGAVGTASHHKKKQAITDAEAQLFGTAPFTKHASMETVIGQAQHDYDEDPTTGTDHGTKAAEQAQWEADIVANLPAYPIP